MFLRDSLFRLCEQSLNGNISQQEVVAVYKQIQTAATDIVKTDQTKTEAKAQEANNKELQLQLQMKQILLPRKQCTPQGTTRSSDQFTFDKPNSVGIRTYTPIEPQ